MNIIEAVKSGKYFRRPTHDIGLYLYNLYGKLHYKYSETRIEDKGKKYNAFSLEDILSEDWEVKEDHKEIIVTFDPTKPVQTRDGRSARIICTDRKGILPIVGIIQKGISSEDEYCDLFDIDGKYCHDSSQDHRYDLINIKEPKPIDIHVGGVYKERSGDIHICINKIDETRNFSTFYSLNIGNSGSYFFDLHRDRIIEHLGDIQDLNTYIKEKLK